MPGTEEKYERIERNLRRFKAEKDFYMFAFWYKAKIGTINRDAREIKLDPLPEPTSVQIMQMYDNY